MALSGVVFLQADFIDDVSASCIFSVDGMFCMLGLGQFHFAVCGYFLVDCLCYGIQQVGRVYLWTLY